MRSTLRARAMWRSPSLGTARDLQIGGGALRCFERGEGPPLVFCNGVLTNANIWRGVVDRLSADFRCIVIDMPMGAHVVSRPRTDRSPRGQARMVSEAIEALELEDATLVGNDTGGAICQIVATRHPQRIAALVLTSCEFAKNAPPLLFRIMNPLSRVPPALALYLLPGLLRPLQRLPVAYGWLSRRPFPREVGDSFVLPTLVDRAIRADFASFLRDYRPPPFVEAAGELPRFTRPVLVAWSRGDRIMPPRHGEELARLLPGARLEWIDDARTLSPEDQPDRVAELIGAFARDVRPLRV